LKVICDEVFGRCNYINTVAVKAKAIAGASGGGEDIRMKKNYEFILVYARDYNSAVFNVPVTKVNLMEYIAGHKENNIGFYYTRIITNYGNKRFIGVEKTGNGDEIKIYEHTDFEFSSVTQLARLTGKSAEEIYSEYFNDIFMVTNAQTSILTRVNSLVNEKNKLISYEYVPVTGRDKGKLTTKMIWNETLIVWLRDTAARDATGVYKLEKNGTLWNNISWGRLDLEGGVKFKNGKKPESLIQTILDMSTLPGDLVLDAFLGSGTTAAVAHKMGRRYIGIELGDHCRTHCLPRLKAVVDGEQGGISKALNWQGGGGFKFYELAPTAILNRKAFMTTSKDMP
jgi:adenine-specific DNA-methyltransferase